MVQNEQKVDWQSILANDPTMQLIQPIDALSLDTLTSVSDDSYDPGILAGTGVFDLTDHFERSTYTQLKQAGYSSPEIKNILNTSKYKVKKMLGIEGRKLKKLKNDLYRQ